MIEEGASLYVELRQHGPIPLDVRFTCDAGQILALVGPSGSGKSTILRSIAGLYTPRHGRIRCAGHEWLDTDKGIRVETRRRSVGVVFQSYALFPHLSALHNVMEALTHLPVAQRAGRARALLARTHLDGLEARRPDQLSGGQQQRVAVARALARDPDVLLLDEPFSAVDQVTRDKLYEELGAERTELRMPTVLVTHALDEAAILADRMCVLHRGTTLQIGTPYEVMTHPASPLVAQVLGLRNLFVATVAEHDHARRITRLVWGKVMLEAALREEFAPGSQVSWFVPQTHVLLHRRDRAQPHDGESAVRGVIVRCAALRETINISLAVADATDAVINFSIPTRIARSNELEAGASITVSLLSEGIHLMPADDDGS